MQSVSVIPKPSFRTDAAEPRSLARAVDDLWLGWQQRRLAWALAWLDTRNRYRGSILGPFWLTLSTAVMVGGLGLLYSTLFKMDLRTYLPFLAVSLLLWNTLNQIVSEACTTFTSAEAIIRQMRLPYSVHIARTVLRNMIAASHSLPLIFVVFLFCDHMPGWEALLIVPGFILVTVNAVAGAFLLGTLCARFRDIPPIVTNIMQLAFFLSPIIWKPELIAPNQFWLVLNPFYVIMEVVRGPLVEGGASLLVWVSATLYSAARATTACALFVRFRRRIAFWV
jgi:lipopolysaccharide transport system permease protein